VSLSENERLSRLRLIRTENVGPATFRTLVNRFGSAEEAINQVGDLSRRGGRSKPIVPAPIGAIEDEWHRTHKLGGEFRMIGDLDYPRLLAAVDPVPPVFSILGHPHLLTERSIAIVGARNASANSRKIAHEIAEGLGAANYTVVSGMARGIDGAAHQGALESGTVAVLAGGIDSIYPKENEDLYHALKERGAILSEMPLGHTGRSKDFPRRNRLISGLALATVVVEAALRSGSLITARTALEQSREVFAVPGSPLDPRCKGANHLIKQGANLVENAQDVVDLLETFVPRVLRDIDPEDQSPAESPPIQDPSSTELDKWQEPAISLLGPAPTEIDEIVRQSGCPPGFVSIIILELELAGRAERMPGQRIALISS
jgi:DNA processing protein